MRTPQEICVKKIKDESVKKCILFEHYKAMRVYAFQDTSEDF
jgi:hypothetical protein